MSTKDILIASILFICFIAMNILEFVNIKFNSDILISNLIKDSAFRFFGGTIFLFIVYYSRYNILNPFKKPFFKSLLIIIPALLISINNFPFVAYFTGHTELTKPFYSVLVFLITCLSVGFFEEIIFRGVFLLFLLQKFPKTQKGIFYSIIISSALFGLMHMLNLLTGASIGPTILQVLYSFVMGIMWAIILIKTKNIWLVVILHAIYNFAGLLFPTLGTISLTNDFLTILLTSIFAFGVSIYMIYLFFSIKPKDVDKLYLNSKN